MIKIEKMTEKKPVYDITVEDNHNFFANDILVHNCAEIIEYTSPEEIAVCNLASICLPMFVNKSNTFSFKKLYDVTYTACINLNKVIDRNYYPVIEARNSNMKHRPIAIGVQGLADVFFKMHLPFESKEASDLNKQIFETIYYAAVCASNDLAKTDGHYESFPGSPASKGLLQFDLWGITPSDRYDWEKKKKDVQQYGLRNSLLTAIMPTASCFTSDVKIQTKDGVKSYQQILEEYNIDWKSIENTTDQRWIEFNDPLIVNTRFGEKESKKIFYNGHVETIKLLLEDGTIYQCSLNHKFLIKRNGIEIWIKAEKLLEEDDIVQITSSTMKIKKIEKGEILPTWDISVDEVQEFVLENGCISHNTASIFGNEASIEAQTSNLYTRKVLAGEFIIANKYLVKELVKRKIWNDNIRQQMIRDNGSIQNISDIPKDLKDLFKTTWEIKQKTIIDMAVDRGPYIDQTQSMNIFIENPNFAKLTSMHFYSWGRRENPDFDATKEESKENSRYIRLKKDSLKTGIYYLRTKSATDAVKFTVDQNIKKVEDILVDQGISDISCSLDNPQDCEACGS